jgi:hypothetical protein
VVLTSLNIVKKVKLSWLWWTGQVAWIGKVRSLSKILVLESGHFEPKETEKQFTRTSGKKLG